MGNPNNHEKMSLVDRDPVVAARVGTLLATAAKIERLTIMNGPGAVATGETLSPAQLAADRAAFLAQASLSGSGAEIAEA